MKAVASFWRNTGETSVLFEGIRAMTQLTWEALKKTNPNATALAESGNIREAVGCYAHGGAYSYGTSRSMRKCEKAQINASVLRKSRNAAHKSVNARIFFMIYRRFYLPTQSKNC